MKKLFDQMKRRCGIAFTRTYLNTDKYLVISSWNWYSDYDRHFYDAREFDSLEAAEKYIEYEIPKIRQDSMHIFKKIDGTPHKGEETVDLTKNPEQTERDFKTLNDAFLGKGEE